MKALYAGLLSFAVTAAAVDTNDVKQLPSVTVHGQLPSMERMDAEAALARTAGGADLVGAEEFRDGRARTLEDVLAWTPGVFAQERQEGSEVRLSIRGSALDRGYHLRGVKLLLDGVPVSFADGSGDFQNLDPLTLQFVEVWRGPNALPYGATTLGGAINAVMQTGSDASRAQARIEAGSWDTYRAQLSSGGVWTNGDYYVSGSADSRLGYQTHSEASAVRFSGNLGWRWNDTTETRFYVGYVHAESELPGNLTKEEIENSPRVASPTSVAFDEERNTDWARLAAKTTWRPSDDRSLSASLYWSWQDLDHPLFWNPFFLNGLGVLRDESHTAGADFRYVTTDPLWERRNAFTIGFAPAATRLEDLRYANNGGSAGAKVADGLMNAANLDLYAENQHYVTESLALVAGAQGTYAIRNYNDRFDTDPNGDQSRDQDYWGFNPKLGLLYDWAGFGQFFASVSRSFEPPTSIEFIQLGGPAGDILTRSLDAQTATTAEVGMRGERDRYAWDVTYYHSWLKDELLTLNDALGNPLGTVNGPDTTHQGVELGASVKLVEGLCGENAADKLMLRQIYNWSDFRFRDDDLYGDNRLPGIPEHVLRTELLYEHPCGFYVGPNVQWVPSRTWADYANTLRSDSYFTLGAKIGYRSARGLSVYFEARNLTDENYASAVEPIADASTAFGTPRVFHPGEGRSFYGGLEWKW